MAKQQRGKAKSKPKPKSRAQRTPITRRSPQTPTGKASESVSTLTVTLTISISSQPSKSKSKTNDSNPPTTPPTNQKEDTNTIYFNTTAGPLGYLSNSYRCVLTCPYGIKYNSAEQYIQFQKALAFDDEDSMSKIHAASTIHEIKKLGKQIRGFEDEPWDFHKSSVVFDANYLKFTGNESLCAKLLATGEKKLVMAGRDKVWGIGFAEGEAEGKRGEWGENLLGEALMFVRAQIRGERAGERKAWRVMM